MVNGLNMINILHNIMGKKKKFQIDFPIEQYQQIEKIAKDYGVTKTSIIKFAIAEFIKKKK